MKKYIQMKHLITLGMITLSAVVMAIANNSLIEQANLLPGGFMGIARLVSLSGQRLGIAVSASIILLGINIPVALVCAKRISRRFVLFSVLQIVFFNVFTSVLPRYHVFDQEILNVIFGGAIWGVGIAMALRGNASTGGTDFIALYVANRTGKEIWMQVFSGNCVLLVIFGMLFGWEKAGYSIIFQFISTRMIDVFHNRYKRVMIQIFTKKPDGIVRSYLEKMPHGITIFDGIGGYTRERTSMLTAIISSYELHEVIELVQAADPHAIINVTKSDKLVGNFKQPDI